MPPRFAFLKQIAAMLAAMGAMFLLPAIAQAQCCTPPPPCCKPPTPPSPCCNGGHNINVPNVNVNVGATVIVNAQATAVGVAGARAGGGAIAFGGGGSSVMFSPGSPGLIQGLDVQGCCKQAASYQAERTKIRIVIIRAVCVDDRDVPHPASQVTPDRELAETYEGEVFRCLAGTRMQVTMSDYVGKIDFGPGETMNCAKGEALYRDTAGALSCRPQTPARDCNERSLLRRYGAGVKIIKIITKETYTAYREEEIQSRTAALSMTIDGGVGGIVY